ncbi:AEC family transporter [Pseudopelagicola sp. nBUS_20]|uniref:AEC family transporter n=1 Tax=Pseudopelagicola sp. nBUS_20 TaxID=3395317 RepID=UPI003EB876BB
MNLILTVLEIVAPVFLLAGLGFIWVRLGYEYPIQFVTRLAMTLAVPCLVFSSLMQAETDLGKLVTLSLASLTGYAAISLAAWLLLKISNLDLRTYLAPLVFGNTGNLGLPLAFFAFGQVGLEYAVVVFAIMSVPAFTFGVWLVAGGGPSGRIIREPMVWAAVFGALFLWQGWQTPQFITNTIDLVGQTGIPLMLVTLGVAVARLAPEKVFTAAWLSLAKTLLCTLIAWEIGFAYGLTGIEFSVLVLQLATPVAVTSYLLAEKYEADSEAVAGFVVVSTLTSVFSLPILLAVLL